VREEKEWWAAEDSNLRPLRCECDYISYTILHLHAQSCIAMSLEYAYITLYCNRR
jgi:hypothetical protein